jgi:hypothetical protein
MKRWMILPAALVLTTAGCGGTSSSARSASSSAPSSPTSATDPLAGTWETAALPTATFVETFRRAGATPVALAGFQSGLAQAGQQHRYIVRIGAGFWVELEQHDGNTPQTGWAGTYTRTGNTVHATETSTGCHLIYGISLAGDALRVRLLSDTPETPPQCGRTDSWPQRAIYETAVFHRVS